MFDNNAKVTPDANTEGQQIPQPAINTSPFDTMLSEIRNEHGQPKYRTVEDGLNALKHSQSHITTLTTERSRLERDLQEANEKLAKMAELEETVQKLTRRTTDPEPQAPQFDEETIANLVDSRLTHKQQQEAALHNQRVVAGKLSEVYGEKARELFYGKAAELGFTESEFEALAAKTPKAVLAMLNVGGGADKQPNKSPVPSKVNTDGFQQKPTTFIGAEKERIPLGGGDEHYRRILENSQQMVQELGDSGMSVHDLTDPANYFKFFKQG